MPSIGNGNFAKYSSASPASAEMSSKVDPVYESKKYLLNLIMERCGISDEDLKDTSLVKSKIREANIDSIVK